MRLIQGVVAMMMLLAAWGCSSAPAPSSQSTGSVASTESSTFSTSTTLDPKAAAQASLDEYWAMVKRLNGAPNPDDPQISQLAVDPSASAIRALLTSRLSQGLVERYDGVPYSVTATIGGVDAQVATFTGCIVDGALLVDSATGQVQNDAVSTSSITGVLAMDNGSWKVSRYDVIKKVDGVVPCDAL